MKWHRDHKAICVQTNASVLSCLSFLSIVSFRIFCFRKFIILVYDLIKLKSLQMLVSVLGGTALRNTMGKPLPLLPNPRKAPIRVPSQLKTLQSHLGRGHCLRNSSVPITFIWAWCWGKTLLKETLPLITQIHINTSINWMLHSHC